MWDERSQRKMRATRQTAPGITCARNPLMLSQSRRRMPATVPALGEAEAELQAHHQPELYRETLSQKSAIPRGERKSYV